MNTTNFIELDFNNLEKYKPALDDGFVWGDAGFKTSNKAITLQAVDKVYFFKCC